MSSGIDTGYRDQQPDYSVLPPAVRKQAERAEALSKAVREGKDPNTVGQPEQPAQQPPAAPQAPAPAQAAPQTPPPVPQPPASTQEPPKGGEDWEQKYKSLQGQFEARNREFRELLNGHNTLARRVEELETQPQTTPPTPADSTFDITKVLTEGEIEDWGPEFGGILSRAIQAAQAPLLQEIQNLKGSTSSIINDRVKSARDQMHETLDADVPDWVNINTAEDFLEWVNKNDPASGKRRQALLKDAYEKNDTSRVRYFFDSFLREVRGASPEDGRRQVDNGRATAPGKSRDLTDFAAPGKGKQAPAQVPSEPDEPQPISRAEIIAFYADKARGKLKISPEEAVKFEQDIERAQRENRII